MDRIYTDQLGSDEPSDEEIYQKYVTNRPAKDPYSEEVGPGAGIMRGLDSWLGENVNEPLAKAGYPKVGAGLSAAGSAVADLAIPQTAGDFAGVLVPFGKAGKAASKLEGVAGKAAKGSEADIIERFGKNSLEHRQYKAILDETRGLPLDQDLPKELPAGFPTAEGRPLTKEEMAAKRSANNKSVIQDLKGKNSGDSRRNMISEESPPEKSAREQMNEKNSNARDVDYKKRLNDRANAVKNAVESGEVKNPHLMEQDDLDTAWDHAFSIKNRDKVSDDVRKVLDDEKFRRFEARQKHGPAWRAKMSLEEGK